MPDTLIYAAAEDWEGSYVDIRTESCSPLCEWASDFVYTQLHAGLATRTAQAEWNEVAYSAFTPLRLGPVAPQWSSSLEYHAVNESRIPIRPLADDGGEGEAVRKM